MYGISQLAQSYKRKIYLTIIKKNKFFFVIIN